MDLVKLAFTTDENVFLHCLRRIGARQRLRFSVGAMRLAEATRREAARRLEAAIHLVAATCWEAAKH